MDEVPPGHVRVEWVLPNEVVRTVSARAAETGSSEGEIVALLLSGTTSAFTRGDMMTRPQATGRGARAGDEPRCRWEVAELESVTSLGAGGKSRSPSR